MLKASREKKCGKSPGGGGTGRPTSVEAVINARSSLSDHLRLGLLFNLFIQL